MSDKKNLLICVVFFIFFSQIFLINKSDMNTPVDQFNLEPAASDTLTIEFYIEPPSVTLDDTLNIVQVVVNYTATNDTVPDDDLTVHKFNIYNENSQNSFNQ